MWSMEFELRLGARMKQSFSSIPLLQSEMPSHTLSTNHNTALVCVNPSEASIYLLDSRHSGGAELMLREQKNGLDTGHPQSASSAPPVNQSEISIYIINQSELTITVHISITESLIHQPLNTGAAVLVTVVITVDFEVAVS